MLDASKQSILEGKLRIACTRSVALAGFPRIEEDIFPSNAYGEVGGYTLAEYDTETCLSSLFIFWRSIERKQIHFDRQERVFQNERRRNESLADDAVGKRIRCVKMDAQKHSK